MTSQAHGQLLVCTLVVTVLPSTAVATSTVYRPYVTAGMVRGMFTIRLAPTGNVANVFPATNSVGLPPRPTLTETTAEGRLI